MKKKADLAKERHQILDPYCFQFIGLPCDDGAGPCICFAKFKNHSSLPKQAIGADGNGPD